MDKQNIDMKKIIDWNKDQLEHIRIFQQLMGHVGTYFWHELVFHDKTKFQKSEYSGFLEAHDGLKNSVDGPSDEYLEQCKKQAIVDHVENNSHHPEYWRKKGKKMPFTCVVAMYFDWVSRTIVKDGHFTEKWWAANKQKCLDCLQDHAIPVVELLKEQFPPERFQLLKTGKLIMLEKLNEPE